MDETWVHHHTLERKRSSAEWTADGESRPKGSKDSTMGGQSYGILILRRALYFVYRLS